jgi:hypothetical protein
MTADPLTHLPANAWIDDALATVHTDPGAIRPLFPAVGRNCGRGPLLEDSPWTVDDAVRVVLLAALPYGGERLVEELTTLYRQGDAAERRGVLRALARLEPRIGALAVPLVRDALATNDARLVSAALGDYAARHIDADAFRQAVLKCVFLDIPLGVVAGLADRMDEELVRMLLDYAQERAAAGRDMPVDVRPIVERYFRDSQD